MKNKFTAIFFALLLTGCANSTCSNNTPNCSDPFEGFNRSMFSFNYNVLDPYIARPAAIFWKNYVPSSLRIGLGNFTSNLTEPASMVNYLLQGEMKQAMIHFTRFFLNTTIGLVGFIDVAGMADRQLNEAQSRQFGSVLGHYGVSYGPYLTLPIYGSATIREDGGKVVDSLYPPLSYLTFGMGLGKWLIEGLESRAQALEYDHILKESQDPYGLMREAYYQRKNFLANDGKVLVTPTENQKEINDVLDEIDSID